MNPPKIPRNIRFAKITLVVLGTLGLVCSTHGAVIAADYLIPGDSLLVLDVTNNREWVQPTKTTGMSVNQFLATSIYAGAGFQLATSADIAAFFTSAGAVGISLNSTNFLPANVAPAEHLNSLFGHAPPYTQTASNTWVHGYEDYGSVTNLTVARYILDNYLNPTSATFDLGTNGTGWNYNTSHSAVGVWAFREASISAVPEPSGILALGCLLAAGISLRSRRAS